MFTGDTTYYSGGPEFEIRLGFQFLLLKFFIVCPSRLPVNDSCTIKQTTSALSVKYPKLHIYLSRGGECGTRTEVLSPYPRTERIFMAKISVDILIYSKEF